MAGRPGTRGGQVQADKGGYRPARGGAARGYSWPPFEAGNTAAMRSGAYSPRVAGPLAEVKLGELLAADWLPDRVKGPEARGGLEKLAQLLARAELLGSEVSALDLAVSTVPRRPAGKNSPMDLWLEAEAQVARQMDRLGIDGPSLLAEQREAQAEGDLEAMAGLGARIRARREAQGRGEGEEE